MLSEYLSQAAPHAKLSREPTIEIDLRGDDNDDGSDGDHSAGEESTSAYLYPDEDNCVLQQHAPDVGTSTSGTIAQAPPEEG